MYSSITMQMTTVTQKGQVTIPKPIRQALGVEPGQKVAFEKKKDQIIIKTAVDFFSLRGSLKSRKPFDVKAMDKAVEKLVVSEYASKQARINRH